MQFLAYTPNSDPKIVIFLKIRTPFQKTACVPGYYDWKLVSPGIRWLPVANAIKHIGTQDCIACNYCKGVYNSMHVSLEIPVFRQISAFRSTCTISFPNNDVFFP